MRNINLIVIHCSATKKWQDVGAEDIRKWHLDRGWSDIGYHYVIKRNGDIQLGRPFEKMGAHARGYNRNSIGICLVGGLDDDGKPQDNFSFRQYFSLVSLLSPLIQKYPNVKIIGHGELPGVAKACPCFDVEDWLAELGGEDYYAKELAEK